MKRAMRWMAASALAMNCLSAFAADKVLFQLDWLPGGDKSPIYVALKQGYFKAEDLDVTVRTGRGSTDAVSKLAAGAADVGVGGMAALMMAAAEGGVPVKAIMSIYSKQPDAIFTVKGNGITNLKSLTGKTIATAPFSSSNALWPVILEANGIDPSKVTVLKVDPSAMAPMLAQGKVDASINWVTVAPGFENVLKQAGKELSVLPWTSFGLDGYGWSFMASDKMIKERPEVLKRVVRALNKGFQFALANPAAAGSDLNAIVPEVNGKEAAAEFQASIPLIKNDISAAKGFGTFDPVLLKNTWTWVAKSMNYPAARIDPEKLVDRSFLSAR
ncbi:ABC transporter substrate-binding protein [Herbaspirillum autotrophicum]|uniref:ABC transporter substrate-binding protein n=1 Tax=Herbaspirillum autotrophicum TaxID=180195 RepID=UPI00067D57FA|nr:ABC transporter substrate-binding protein [Herbaspirillum autotrophicum]